MSAVIADAAVPTERRGMDGWFRDFAERTASALGRPVAFLTAFALVLVWAVSGPFFHYSEEWQIVINTSTTIVTFLMVFLLQNTQTRDSRAIHLKLNELLRAIADARTAMVRVESLPDAEIEQLRTEFATLAEQPCEPVAEHDPVGGKAS